MCPPFTPHRASLVLAPSISLLLPSEASGRQPTSSSTQKLRHCPSLRPPARRPLLSARVATPSPPLTRRKVPRGPGAIVLSGAEKFGQLGAVARLEVGPSGLAEQSEGQGAEREHGEAGLGPGAGGLGPRAGRGTKTAATRGSARLHHRPKYRRYAQAAAAPMGTEPPCEGESAAACGRRGSARVPARQSHQQPPPAPAQSSKLSPACAETNFAALQLVQAHVHEAVAGT